MIYVEVLSKIYFSFGYYDFYRHREDKNDCEVLEWFELIERFIKVRNLL